MQGHSSKYIFRFKDKKIVIGKLPHESEFQVYAKALVYALFQKEYPTIRVEPKLDDRFQPDLSAVHYDGTTIFLVECGKVSIDKIEKLFKKYRHAHYVFVKEEKDVPLFEKQMNKLAKEMRTLPLVDILIYPEHFQDWNVSEEGDVFIRKEDVTMIRWSDPGNREKYY